MAVRISQVGLQWTLHRFGWPFSLRFCDCSQQSRFQTARRCHEKISFAINFGHNSFVLDDVNLAELSNNSFVSKDVKFFFFWGVKIYSDTSYIFSVGDPELVMGHFFKTQPNPTQNFWTQPNPTQPTHGWTQPMTNSGGSRPYLNRQDLRPVVTRILRQCEFQTVGAAEAKAREPNVLRRTRGTVSRCADDGRSRTTATGNVGDRTQ